MCESVVYHLRAKNLLERFLQALSCASRASNFPLIPTRAINVVVDDYWWDIRSVKYLITKHYEMRKAVPIVTAVTQLILKCSLLSSLIILAHWQIVTFTSRDLYVSVYSNIFDYNHVRISRFSFRRAYKNFLSDCTVQSHTKVGKKEKNRNLQLDDGCKQC